MKTDSKNKNTRLEFFSELYENAKRCISEYHTELDKYMSQYKGSDEIDGSGERAVTVRNITYELIESQISSDVPISKIDPYTYSERHAKCAGAAQRLCYAVRAHLPFEKMNDLDERYTYVYGGSVWFVEWNNSKSFGGERGGVDVHCISPKCFIPQPGISRIDDMEYCFLVFTTTRDEVMRRYGISEKDAELLSCEYSYADTPDGSDAVNITVTFFRDEGGEVGQYVFSGDVELSCIDAYYKRKIRVCKKCGLPEGACSCGADDFTTIDLHKEPLDEGVRERFPDLKELSVPYYTPKKFPIVIRKNTTTDDLVFGQSDCAFIRHEQQAVNKVESRILQKLLRAGVTPVMPEDATLSLNNSVFGQVIKMKPGEKLDQYGKIDTTPDISQDVMEAERLYDHAKRTLGISDAYQGIDTGMHESGVAKQLRISQANSRLESKKKMKYTAYAEIDRLIFEHYLAFADEPRQVSYKDAYGRVHSEEFNRRDFLDYDKRTGKLFYDDGFLFSVDLNGGTEYQREELWQRNLDNLRTGTLGDATDPVTLLRYWQSQERAHYPYARENVEYFTRIVDEAGAKNADTAQNNSEKGEI